MHAFRFDLTDLPPAAEALRGEVRDFLRAELKDRRRAERADSWGGFDPAFSRKVGARGWIGGTGPHRGGPHPFNEGGFEDALIPEDLRVGGEGDGWKQVTTELAFERSGPERYLSSFALLLELVRREAARPR